MRPSKASKAAITRAKTTIAVTALRADVNASPGDFVGVGGMLVLVGVFVEVGQGVIVGRSVGVPVGEVGVGV